MFKVQLITHKNLDVEDFPEYVELLQKINYQLDETRLEPQFSTGQSSSSVQAFFKAKNAWMINYLIGINLYILHRFTNGDEVPQSLLDRLLESRLMVSKMSTVQKKLQYQVDRIVQVAAKLSSQEEATSDIDPLQYKPRPEMLESQYNEEKKKTIYRAPKLAAALSKEDQTAEKMKKQNERRIEYLKRKQIRSLMEEVNENEDQPKEITTGEYQKRYFGQEQDRHDKAREEYEEENFTRLPITKADKRREKQREKNQKMEEHIDNFGEIYEINELLRREGMADDGPGYTKTQYSGIQKKKRFGANGQKKIKKNK